MSGSPEMYFAASGYSAAESTQPDLSVFRLSENGQILPVCSVCRGDNPSYLLFFRDELYVACERADCAVVAVYRFSGSALECVREFCFPYAGLCHLSAVGTRVFGSCYAGGAFFCADTCTGELLWGYRSYGTEPHAHSTLILPGDRLCTADLGTGEVACFSLRNGVPAERLGGYSFLAGEGPREMIPVGSEMLCVLENASAAALLSAEGGKWSLRQQIPASCSDEKNYPSSAVVCGRRVLLANRGADTVAVFSYLPDGKLVFCGENPAGGNFPRHISLSPDGRFLLTSCQKSDRVCSISPKEACFRVLDSAFLPNAACTAFLTMTGERQ